MNIDASRLPCCCPPNPRGGGNGENQCYTARPENVRVASGRLILEARRGTYQGSNEVGAGQLLVFGLGSA